MIIMIPIIPELKTTSNVRSYHDKTYLFDFFLATPKLKVTSITGGIPAIEQAVLFILNTERYQHPIYSWNYGVELFSLYGQPIGVVKAELQRRITEALTMDDRITGVADFSFAQKGKVLIVSFVVYTKYGELPVETEVDV